MAVVEDKTSVSPSFEENKKKRKRNRNRVKKPEHQNPDNNNGREEEKHNEDGTEAREVETKERKNKKKSKKLKSEDDDEQEPKEEQDGTPRFVFPFSSTMDSPNPPSMRVLTRPPPSPVPTPSSNPPPPLPPSSPSLPRSPDGVVVVGFLSRRPDDSSQLINRVLDSNVFGSGQVDRVLSIDKDELKDWFKHRRISYYHEEDKGILFLQFSSNGCPFFDGSLWSGSDFSEVLEEREFGDLQGLLFMFSVCHIIIYVQEGSCFGTQILKKFRVLQAAKHALIPYVKSRTAPPLPSRPHSSSSSRPSTAATAFN